MNEKQVQKYAVDLFKALGCRVLSTSQIRRSKVSIGLPDLFIRKDSWIPASWVAVEIKGDQTPIRKEQKELLDVGALIIVRGFDGDYGIEGLATRVRVLDSILKKDTKAS